MGSLPGANQSPSALLNCAVARMPAIAGYGSHFQFNSASHKGLKICLNGVQHKALPVFWASISLRQAAASSASTTNNGTLTMATDQNSSVIVSPQLKKKGESREASYDEIVEAKITLAKHLSPLSSAILVDAYYGAWNVIAGFSVPRQVGLLVRVETSGGPKNARGGPLGAIEPGWRVHKIKRMGADAVKLLAQFEPTETDSAEHQFAFVQQIYQECQQHYILLLLETVVFRFGGEKKDSKSFIERKAETVIESARKLSRFCDIYKAEFLAISARASSSFRRISGNSTPLRNARGCYSALVWTFPTTRNRSRWRFVPAPAVSSAGAPSGRNTSCKTASRRERSSPAKKPPTASSKSTTSCKSTPSPGSRATA